MEGRRVRKKKKVENKDRTTSRIGATVSSVGHGEVKSTLRENNTLKNNMKSSSTRNKTPRDNTKNLYNGNKIL